MKKFLNWIGFDHSLERKNRLAYLVLGFSYLNVFLFLFFYIFLIKNLEVIIGTSFCLLCLTGSLLLFRKHYFSPGKYLLIIAFLLQEGLLVFRWFPVAAGLKYYYFIVTPMTFFIFDFQLIKERTGIIIFNIITILSLLATEIVPLNSPLITLSDQMIRFFSALSVTSTSASVLIVFYKYGYILNQTYRNLNILAETDGLTQVHNRRTLFRQGKAIFDISKKSTATFSFILFDIDFFKEVNDKYGHPEGDKVLIQLAQLIQRNIRYNDVFARYGGEEFALIAKDTESDDIETVAEALRKLVEKTPFRISEGRELSLRVSLGVVSFSEHYNSFEEMVVTADKALYQAKRTGRNKVVFLQ